MEQLLYSHGTRKVVVEVIDSEIKDVFISGSSLPVERGEKSMNDFANEHKRLFYNEFFKKQFRNFLVFSGAGTSMGIGKEQKGLSMQQLWSEAGQLLGHEFERICGFVNCPTVEPNLETLLSLIEGHIKFSKLNAEESSSLKSSHEAILKLIREKCNIVAPDEENSFPHTILLKKITQRKATLPRVKVFTLNYDLLFEQAANRIGAVVLDGFSFTTPRVFSGRYFDYDIVQREKSRLKDEDNFIYRLFHLYKIHGSLNWRKDQETLGKIIMDEQCKEPLIIYPRDAKYENSYEQPFFEMVARFQQNLRLDSTVLLCIGYSFSDKHINAVISEALNQNPGFQLVVVNPNFYTNNRFSDLLNQASISERIVLIDEKFSDFALHFPEIKTYTQEVDAVNLNV